MMPAELPETLEERFYDLLERIGDTARATGRKPPKSGSEHAWMACCPAHDDNNPSLSLKLEPHRILVHCFAGCSLDDVMGAVGYPLEALFSDYRQARALAGPKLVFSKDVPHGTSRRELRQAARGWAVSTFETPEPVERLALPPTLSEFQGLEYPEIHPILGPWASQQINLVFAPSGAGKTMLGLSLAYAMAEGEDWLGWEFHGEPRTVLYVDGEMAARMMQQRFGELRSDQLYVANIPGWWIEQGGEPLNLSSEAGQEVLSLWVEATGADVIILDNFMSLAWRDGVGYTSDEIWTAFRRWCVAERARDKCVIMVDHANVKGGVFGTKTKLNIMDLVLEMDPLGDDPTLDEDRPEGSWVRLKFSKTRGFSESLEIVESRDVQIGQVGHAWNRRNTAEEFKLQISNLRKEGMSLREIAEYLDTNYSKVQRAWKRIQRSDSGDSRHR